MKTLQIPFAESSAPLYKCRALFNSFVMIKCNKLFVSETHYFVIHLRGYDIIVCLDSRFGNTVRIDKPYNEKTLYCTPFEEENSLDIPVNPSHMLIAVSNILDNYLKSKL